MKRVEFFYDLVSPYSYLAWPQIHRICEQNGAGLELKPVLLGGVHKAAENVAPVDIPAKGRYQKIDIHRWAEHYGMPLDFPAPFPFRTLKTMRAVMFLREQGKLEDFTNEAFRFYWEEGGAPKGFEEADENGPISEVARRIEADPQEVLEGAATPEAKEALKAATSEAVERGLFGTPAFFVGEEMFWGNDRLHFVEAALRERPKSL